MGHKYIKESDTFSTSQNGTVPKPTAQEVSDGKVLKADGTWGAGGGGGTGDVADVYVNGESVLDEDKIAQIKSYKELTQAQYNALPASKLTDDILYCINDIGGSGGYPPLIYSTQEREIGVWIDGKPLYQKTVVGRITQAGETYIETDTQNVEYAEIVSIVLTDDAYKRSWRDGYAKQIDVAMGGFTSIIDTYLWVSVYVNQSLQYPGDIYITVRYTKTTDTPGSGSWSTSGANAHHYSLTEQIVGTWIDGKPLYEKTVTGTFEYHAMEMAILISTNMESIVDVRGFIIPSDLSTNRVSLETKNNYLWIDTITSGNGFVVFKRGNESNYGDEPSVYLTVCYTKTTD